MCRLEEKSKKWKDRTIKVCCDQGETGLIGFQSHVSRQAKSRRWGAIPLSAFIAAIVVAGGFVLMGGCSRPTFTADIAPIVFKNCAPCHRPGEAGPVPLLTYEDVLKKAKTVAAVTQSRYMPPWPADPSYSRFAGERVLSEADIQLIKSWVEHGSPAGDP